MSALTALGTLHTAIGIVALVAGARAFLRHKEISPRSASGKVYIWATVLTCLTGFGIFQHGGFGDPHALGVLTLLVLAIAGIADRSTLFRRASPYIATLSYSLTFFFHLIPGTTETFTRLPMEAPLFSGPDDPSLKATIGVFFLLYLIGAGLQMRRLFTAGRRASSTVFTSRA